MADYWELWYSPLYIMKNKQRFYLKEIQYWNIYCLYTLVWAICLKPKNTITILYWSVTKIFIKSKTNCSRSAKSIKISFSISKYESLADFSDHDSKASVKAVAPWAGPIWMDWGPVHSDRPGLSEWTGPQWQDLRGSKMVISFQFVWAQRKKIPRFEIKAPKPTPPSPQTRRYMPSLYILYIFIKSLWKTSQSWGLKRQCRSQLSAILFPDSPPWFGEGLYKR